MNEYAIGQQVTVNMPVGWLPGIVKEVKPSYAFSGETYYEIHGDGFLTVAPARSIRPAETMTHDEIMKAEAV